MPGGWMETPKGFESLEFRPFTTALPAGDAPLEFLTGPVPSGEFEQNQSTSPEVSMGYRQEDSGQVPANWICREGG
jgi:hypothetical protein